MIDQSFELLAKDGERLAGRSWLPEGQARGLVQLTHGMAEHIERYTAFARALTEIGLAVYGMDLRGHGRSARSAADLGHWDATAGWGAVLDDLDSLHGYMRKEHPDLPLALFGHSMGSFLVRDFAAERGEKLDALLIFGSDGPVGFKARWGRHLARFWKGWRGPRCRSFVLHALVFGPYKRKVKKRRTDFDWLSRDPAEVDRYMADPLCGFKMSTQFWIEFLGGLQRVEDVARVKLIPQSLPIYIAAGCADPVGGEKGTKALHQLFLDAQLKVSKPATYKEARHELQNEINRKEVIEDLSQWLEQHFLSS